MDTHRSIIDSLEVQRVSKALGLTYNTVYKWRMKDRIPGEYWLDLSDWSASINRPVSLERLAMAAKRARR